ncbi:hypothetical protein A2U01_0055967, partial [Trifolium medium]|nr:hypothetical protein [Trifolium medium]
IAILEINNSMTKNNSGGIGVVRGSGIELDGSGKKSKKSMLIGEVTER